MRTPLLMIYIDRAMLFRVLFCPVENLFQEQLEIPLPELDVDLLASMKSRLRCGCVCVCGGGGGGVPQEIYRRRTDCIMSICQAYRLGQMGAPPPPPSRANGKKTHSDLLSACDHADAKHSHTSTHCTCVPAAPQHFQVPSIPEYDVSRTVLVYNPHPDFVCHKLQTPNMTYPV